MIASIGLDMNKLHKKLTCEQCSHLSNPVKNVWNWLKSVINRSGLTPGTIW